MYSFLCQADKPITSILIKMVFLRYIGTSISLEFYRYTQAEGLDRDKIFGHLVTNNIVLLTQKHDILV